MKTRQELIEQISQSLAGSVELTPATKEEIDYLVDMAICRGGLARLQDRSKITSKEFNLPSLDELQKYMEGAVRKAVDDFVQGAMGEHFFVFLRSNDEFDATAPLTVNIHIPFGDENDPPILKTNLEREFRDYIDDRCGLRNTIDAEDYPAVVTIRDKLAELVRYYNERITEK